MPLVRDGSPGGVLTALELVTSRPCNSAWNSHRTHPCADTTEHRGAVLVLSRGDDLGSDGLQACDGGTLMSSERSE